MQHVRLNLLAAFLLLFSNMAFADENKGYLLFDSNSMLCYEYTATAEADLKAFSDYHLRIEPGRRLIFRIDPTTERRIPAPPQEIYKSEDTELFKPRFREMVNKNFKELFILHADKEGYIGYPVQEIVLFEEGGNAIEYQSRSFSFRYNFDYTYAPGENLLFNASGYGALLYSKKASQKCLDQRTFRFIDGLGQVDFDQYVTFTSKVGLLHIKEGASQEGLFLKRVNEQPMEAFVEKVCQTGRIFPRSSGSINKPSLAEVMEQQDSKLKVADNAVTVPVAEPPKTPQDSSQPEEPYFPKPQVTKPWTLGSKTSTTPAAKPVPPGYYRVKTGDNLSKIAAAHGVALDCLMEANNLKDFTIKIGQDLFIPNTGEFSCPMPYWSVEDKERGITMTYHRVRSGDRLSEIAKKYSTTVEQIQSWNGIADPNDLKLNQALIVRVTQSTR